MINGYLIVNVYSDTIANPIKNARVTVSKNGVDLITKTTDEDGKTLPFTLETVDKIYSEKEQHEVRPYETYDVSVTALGLTPTTIEGVQIFDGVTSIQNIYLTSIDENQEGETSVITPNTLWQEYPQNIQEESSENKETTPLVLSKVLIPENIVVHDGIPTNFSAPNYTVPFIDYIKNVASSEIYSTWPEETIKANVLAIISYTLNRIFTEWYKSRGYDFTITSTTSYDQKYTVNGTIFERISRIVDEIFTNYIRQGYRIEPLLAHYKSSTTEPGNLSQWGSKELGDQGYNYTEILKYYYGDNINIYEAETTQSYPYSFTEALTEGDCNLDVFKLQNTLNYIRGSYPGIPAIENPSGLFNSDTTKAVKTFQKVFNLSQTGTVNYQTWYMISYIFIAVSKMTNSIYN